MPNKLIKNYNPSVQCFISHKELFFNVNNNLIINDDFNDKKYITDNSGICKKDYNNNYFGIIFI